MLWFYLSALVIILGAEVSAEIEHASPWGKAPAGRNRAAEKNSVTRRLWSSANAPSFDRLRPWLRRLLRHLCLAYPNHRLRHGQGRWCC